MMDVGSLAFGVEVKSSDDGTTAPVRKVSLRSWGRKCIVSTRPMVIPRQGRPWERT